MRSAWRTSWLLGSLVLLNSCLQLTKSLKVSTAVPLSDFNLVALSTCHTQGYDYYDSSMFTCQLCPANQVRSTSNLDNVGNSASCECQTGYERVDNNCVDNASGNCASFTCNSCITSNKASYSDHIGCVSCGSSTLGLGSNGECQCSAGKVLQERDNVGNKLTEKQCLDCPSGSLVITTNTIIAGKTYTASVSTCQFCPDSELMTMSFVNGVYSCRCQTGYTMVGVSGIGVQACISTALASTYLQLQSKASIVSYYGANTQITSLTLQHYFTQAATYCMYTHDAQSITYCQLLANLCTLFLYDDDSEVCKVHLAVISSRGTTKIVNEVVNWVSGNPWIYYSTFNGAKSTCQQDLYKTAVSLNGFQMQYVIAAYHLNGTFHGFQSLQTFFTYCQRSAPYSEVGGGHAASTKWQWYASTMDQSYQCDVRSLLKNVHSESLVTQQLFYELYLYDGQQQDAGSTLPTTFSSGGGKFIPVPVRILNSVRRGRPVNMAKYPTKLCDTPDVLVRRFFLFDIVSGISTLDNDPQVIRYASYISLQTLRIYDKQRSIYPPVLNVEYTEAMPSKWSIVSASTIITSSVEGVGSTAISSTPTSSTAAIAATTTNSVDSITFEAYYTMDMTYFFNTLFGFFIAQIIVSLAYFIVRYHNWNIRNSRVIQSAVLTTNLGGINFKNLFEIFLVGLNSYVVAFFPFTLLLSWYFFVFFKLQSVPSIMLPPQFDIYTAESYYYAFVVNLHIMATFQIAYVLMMIVYRQSHANLFFIDWEPKQPSPAVTSGDTAAAHQQHNSHNKVSVWRTILVANEFVEMQTVRRSNIAFTLFFLGFFLLGLKLENNAATQPNLEDVSTPDKFNIILRFANSTFFWLVLSVAQYLWKYLIYERFISEPPEQVFLDFCTIAKVSIIILDEKYHGYYLHCRSPHQYADGTMIELVEMLGKEEAGLTVDRSLEGAPSDVQSFQMFLSGEWSTEFLRIKSQLVVPKTINEILDARRQRQQLLMSNNNNSTGGNRGGGMWGINSRARNAGGVGRNINNRYQGIKVGWSMFMQQTLPPEKVIKAWNEMLTFLQEFIENNIQAAGLRYVVREPTYVEYLLDNAPDLSIPNQPSVFFTDRDWSFTKIWFLGKETDLLLFNILTYSIFDLWFDNTLVSILLCYLCDWGICKVRTSLGQAVISKNTLIDGRFLI